MAENEKVGVLSHTDENGNKSYLYPKVKTDTSLTGEGSPADAATVGSRLSSTLTEAKSYTDTKISGLINGAPTTLDTLKEIADAMAENEDVVETLNAAVGTKANKTDIPTKTSQLTNDSGFVTTDTVYTHPAYTARTGVPTANQTPAFGGTFQVSQPVSDATGHITAVNSRTVTIPKTEATTSAAGLMSATDKTKLDATNVAYGTCSTAAATAEKVVTISGNTNWKLAVGSIIVVNFTNTSTATNVTLNVNNTGAKSIWFNDAVYTGSSNMVTGYAKRPIMYMYDGTNWIWMANSADANTTYTNAALGQGIGSCSTAEATTAKVVSLSSYALVVGGIVAVKFTYAVPASSTLNVNSKGAKAIYYRGAAITANVIKAGDIATFIYNGSQYHLLTVDRDVDTNTDTKVTQTAVTDNANYPLLLTPKAQTATATTTACFDSGVTLNPSTNTIAANVSGNAGTATKWATARTFALSGDATGSVLMDGSTNESLIVKRKSCQVGQSSSTTTNPWYKFASITVDKANNDYSIVFLVRRTYGKNNIDDVGILHAHVRSNASVQFDSASFHWITKSPTVNNSDFVMAYSNLTDGGVTFELWANCTLAYSMWQFDVLSEGGRAATGSYWTLYTTISAGSQSEITSGYTQVASVGLQSGLSSYCWNTARNINGMSVQGTANRFNYGTCSTAAATAEKVVACDGFWLATGSEITVKFTVTNTASNPTLNVNNTGAKAIYYRGSAIAAGYLAVNRTYTFRYNGTQYELVGDLDTDQVDRLRYSSTIKCGTTAIAGSNIIVGKDGLYQHLKLGKAFDITYPILVAASGIAANGTGTNNYKALPITITTTQSITLTAYKPVYIKGKLSGTTFTPVSTKPLTQAVPTTADGYQYILVGLAYNTTQMYLLADNPVYEYSNGSFGLYNQSAANGGIEICESEPASMTAGKLYFVITE